MAQTNPYVSCFAVVEFDVDVGQTTRTVFPPGALTDTERTKVAYLSLPDSNTSVLYHDLVYTFRIRRDTLPLFNASALDHEYSFGTVLFRQQRDAGVRRGFVQRSVVAISDRPYIGLLKAVVKLAGGSFFEQEEAAPGGGLSALQEAFSEICAWPAPASGSSLLLPLLGHMLEFDVPWTALHGYSPALNRRRLKDDLGAGSSASPPPHFSAAGPGSGASGALLGSSGGADASVVLDDGDATPRAPLGLTDAFAVQRQQTPGLFQEIGLFSIFRGLSPCLWHLWELAITGAREQ